VKRRQYLTKWSESSVSHWLRFDLRFAHHCFRSKSSHCSNPSVRNFCDGRYVRAAGERRVLPPSPVMWRRTSLIGSCASCLASTWWVQEVTRLFIIWRTLPVRTFCLDIIMSRSGHRDNWPPFRVRNLSS